MKYIKNFNEKNKMIDILYKSLDSDEYHEAFPLAKKVNFEKITNNEINIIKEISKDWYLDLINIGDDKFKLVIYRSGSFRPYIHIVKLFDDYFYVIKPTNSSSNPNNYWKCDQIDGLISLLITMK